MLAKSFTELSLGSLCESWETVSSLMFLVAKVDGYKLHQMEMWAVVAGDLDSISEYHITDPDGSNLLFHIPDVCVFATVY